MEFWINQFLSEDGKESDLEKARSFSEELHISNNIIEKRLKEIYCCEMNEWINLFIGKYGEESHYKKALHYANLCNMKLPISPIIVQQTFNNIYKRKVNYWLSQFLGYNGSVTHLQIAIRYASILKLKLPLTTTQINNRLKELDDNIFNNYKIQFLESSCNKRTLYYLDNLGNSINFKDLLIEVFLYRNDNYIKKDIKHLVRLWNILNFTPRLLNNIIELIIEC